MDRVLRSTVLVGVGSIGAKAVERTGQSLHGDHRQLSSIVGPSPTLGARLRSALEQLLRAGAHTDDVREPRLDILVFAGILEGEDDELAVVIDDISRVIADDFGAIFPINRPPEQRTAALHLVLVCPALTTSPVARRALQRLSRIEVAALNPVGYPVVSRIWVVALQTTAGTLSSEDAIHTAAHFALATVGSGLRDHEAMRARMDHQAGEGLVGFLSIASLDVPEASLREYAATRAAFDALTLLVDRVQRQVSDPTEGEAAAADLGHPGWLSSFNDGDSAQKITKVAYYLSGGAGALPERLRVGPFAAADQIRADYPELFQPALSKRPPSEGAIAELEGVLADLDRAESAATRALSRGLQRVLDAKLGSDSGLLRLPAVEHGLSRVVAALRDQQDLDRAPPDPAGGDEDPGRDALEGAVAALPDATMVNVVGAAVGLAAGFGSMLLCQVVLAAPAAVAAAPAATGPVFGSPPPPAATSSWLDWLPWAIGVVMALVVGGGVASVAGYQSRQAVITALEARRDALLRLRQAGGSAERGARAAAQLRLRRRRLRRGAVVAIENLGEQLTAVKRTLLDEQVAQRQRLVNMGVRLGASPEDDDIHALIGDAGLLHDWLVPPRVLSAFAAECRQTAQPELWATDFLAANWPTRGIQVDVPCADAARVRAVCLREIDQLSSRNLFDEAEAARAASAAAEAFAARVTLALAPPCIPRDGRGDPVAGVRSGQVLTVGPQKGKAVLEGALSQATSTTALWAPTSAPRLLFLRTWEGLTVSDVARGAGQGSRP